MKKSKYSAIIVGSGISGLFAALELAKYKNLNDGILLVSKSQLNECNSNHAQGGMVAVTKDNSFDTITICDKKTGGRAWH